MLGLLASALLIAAQTPTPVFRIGHLYSPYSRLGTDNVQFICSYTYSATTFNSLSNISLAFYFNASSGSAPANLATFQWSYSSSTTYSATLPSEYKNRAGIAIIADTGAFKNTSVTLVSYNLTDVGYYYCVLTDSTGTTTTSSASYLNGYCM